MWEKPDGFVGGSAHPQQQQQQQHQHQQNNNNNNHHHNHGRAWPQHQPYQQQQAAPGTRQYQQQQQQAWGNNNNGGGGAWQHPDQKKTRPARVFDGVNVRNLYDLVRPAILSTGALRIVLYCVCARCVLRYCAVLCGEMCTMVLILVLAATAVPTQTDAPMPPCI